jgi:hypothetical protein
VVVDQKRQIEVYKESINSKEWRLDELYVVRDETDAKIKALQSNIEHDKQSILDIYRQAFIKLNESVTT